MISANTQASIVLAAAAIGVGPLASRGSSLLHRGWPVVVGAAVGGAALFVAVWLLLDVVLPRMDASGHGSFQTWSTCDQDSLKSSLSAEYRLDELRVMSRIATAKYEGLRRAGWFLKTAILLLGGAALLSALT
jgi:hypothetical protein